MTFALEVKEDLGYYTVQLPLGFKYRILFVSDVHMRDSEFKNTVGYVAEQERILLRILEGVKRGLYNTVIFLGDLFDHRYKDVSKSLYHISIIENIKIATQGRTYKVLSNHPINNKKNSVLTFFLTGQIIAKRFDGSQALVQASADSVVSNYGLVEPILIAPDRLWINGNLISFFHYSRFDKNYYDPLTDIAKHPTTHIGCYHDALLDSNSRQYINDISTGGKFDIPFLDPLEKTRIFQNVDYAMIGDIHSKIGEFVVHDPLTGKNTLADIPGTLGRTANHTSQLHNEVMLPLLEIAPDGTVTKEHIRMELRDYKDIFKVELQEEIKESKSRIVSFRETLDALGMFSSFVDALGTADIDLRSKEILKSLYEDGEYKSPYQEKLSKLYNGGK